MAIQGASILFLTVCLALNCAEDSAFSVCVFECQIAPDAQIRVPDLPSADQGDKLQVQKMCTAQYSEVVDLEPGSTLDQHSFSLPACRVSESVKQLMELAYQTLLEATASSDQW